VWDYFLGKVMIPQGPLVYSRNGLESLLKKPLNGREVRLPSYLYPGVECSPLCLCRLRISPPRPMP